MASTRSRGKKKQATSKRGPYKNYTVKQRKQALRDVSTLGLGEAATKHKVPKSTLENWWRKKNGLPAKAKNAPSRAAETEPSPSKQQRPKRRVAKIYTPSQKAEILEYAAAEGVTEAHRKFDVSRFTIYDWQRKLRLAAEGKGDSPTSGPDPSDVQAQRDREILDEWHRHPGLGPSQIRNQLRRKGVKVSVQTTRRVMEDAGYRPPKVKRKGHDERFEAVRPNHIWHLDYVHRFINRTPVHTLILLDDHSRYVQRSFMRQLRCTSSVGWGDASNKNQSRGRSFFQVVRSPMHGRRFSKAQSSAAPVTTR